MTTKEGRKVIFKQVFNDFTKLHELWAIYPDSKSEELLAEFTDNDQMLSFIGKLLIDTGIRF